MTRQQLSNTPSSKKRVFVESSLPLNLSAMDEEMTAQISRASGMELHPDHLRSSFSQL